VLVSGFTTFKVKHAVQEIDDELSDLGAAYGPPGGRILLALADGAPAGCVAG